MEKKRLLCWQHQRQWSHVDLMFSFFTETGNMSLVSSLWPRNAARTKETSAFSPERTRHICRPTANTFQNWQKENKIRQNSNHLWHSTTPNWALFLQRISQFSQDNKHKDVSVHWLHFNTNVPRKTETLLQEICPTVPEDVQHRKFICVPIWRFRHRHLTAFSAATIPHTVHQDFGPSFPPGSCTLNKRCHAHKSACTSVSFGTQDSASSRQTVHCKKLSPDHKLTLHALGTVSWWKC